MDRRGQNRQLKSVEPVAGRKLDAKTPADQSNEPSPKPIGERKKTNWVVAILVAPTIGQRVEVDAATQSPMKKTKEAKFGRWDKKARNQSRKPGKTR